MNFCKLLAFVGVCARLVIDHRVIRCRHLRSNLLADVFVRFGVPISSRDAVCTPSNAIGRSKAWSPWHAPRGSSETLRKPSVHCTVRRSVVKHAVGERMSVYVIFHHEHASLLGTCALSRRGQRASCTAMQVGNDVQRRTHAKQEAAACAAAGVAPRWSHADEVAPPVHIRNIYVAAAITIILVSASSVTRWRTVS